MRLNPSPRCEVTELVASSAATEGLAYPSRLVVNDQWRSEAVQRSNSGILIAAIWVRGAIGTVSARLKRAGVIPVARLNG
jgi:hypothetical protein